MTDRWDAWFEIVVAVTCGLALLWDWIRYERQKEN